MLERSELVKMDKLVKSQNVELDLSGEITILPFD